jgi:hypothetical protein
MRKLILVFTIFTCCHGYSQHVNLPECFSYTLENDPAPTVLTDEEKKEGAIIIKDKRIVEISFDVTGKSAEPFIYYTKHLQVVLNSDNAIEEYNTVYIPMSGNTELINLEARFISKSGKLTTFNKGSVKDVANYQNHGPYKIFAMEGVELGGTIEYMYTVKRPYEIYGTETYRSNYNYREISLDIFSPSHLKYDSKSYNGLPDLESKTNDLDKNQLHLSAKNVAGFESELYSAQDASYPRVEYKLAYNNSGQQHKRLYTWKDAAEAYYSCE